MVKKPLYLAAWSGPRNISTALMRSWGNRPDTHVCDEPFYAHYLQYTGLDHPGADEVIAHHETDLDKIIHDLTGPLPDGKQIYYQKHMTKHMLPHIDRRWMKQVTNCFLIREPKDVITSFMKVVPNPTLHDTGYREQLELFHYVCEFSGTIPLVLDSKDILQNPERLLRLWCEQLGLEFMDAMLHWKPGVRETDGIWAKHWYHSVEQSSTFAPYKPKDEPVPDHLLDLVDECNRLYNEMYAHRLH